MRAFRQFLRVFGTQFLLLLRGRTQFHVSFLLELLVTGVWMVVYLLFWRVIFSKISYFSGWTFPSLVVFVAFQELFFGMSRGLFYGALGFAYIIRMGRLDLYVLRPMDPRLACICINIQPVQLIRSGIMAGLCIGIAISMGFPFRLLHLLLSVILALLAALGKALMAFTVSYIAFWWGNVDAVYELMDAVDSFLQVPMNVMPTAFQLLFTLGIPLMFAATFPALFAGAALSAEDLLIPLMLLALGLGAWWGLQEWVWRKGLHKYESYGG